MNNQPHTTFPRLFTEKEAAKYLGVSPSYLQRDRSRSTAHVVYCRFDTMVRYTKADLDAWLKENVK